MLFNEVADITQFE